MGTLFEDITLRDLQATFDADLMEEAMQLHLEGQVENVELDVDGSLRGMVQDGRRRYRVSISPLKNKLQMTCECGRMHGRPCAHALALLVEWVADYQEGEDFEPHHMPEPARAPVQGPVRAVPASFYPPVDEATIRKDWADRLKNLTVKEMRDLAAARRLKIRGTLREQVWEGLLQALVEPGAIEDALERLAPDSYRLLDLLSTLVGAAPRYNSTQIVPYLEAALDNGLKARPANTCLRELSDVGLYQIPEAVRGSPVPLQVLALARPDPGLFKPFTVEPERVDLAQPYQFTRLALRLLLMAQGGQLRCAVQDKSVARGSWPGQPGAERSADEVEIVPEGAYLENGLCSGLASALGLPEASIELAARLLDSGGLWAQRAPQRLTERVPDWLRLSPQEQSRRLFALAAGYPTQTELDLARHAGFTPWRIPHRSPGYQEFLAELGWARLRLARLVAHLPAGQWFEVDSVLRTVQGLQPGWMMEYHTRHDNPGSRNARDTLATGVSIGKARVDPFRYPDWLKTYGRLHLTFLTHTLLWLGLVDVGWQGGQPAAVRLSAFGEFLVGRQSVFELPVPQASEPALLIRANWALELNLDTAPLDLVNLLLKIAAPAPEASKGKQPSQKLVYRIYEGGLGEAFDDGWTLEQIVSYLESGLGAPLPAELLARMQPLWERFGRLHIYDDMTLIEFSDDFALPELLAATSLSQILLTTFTPRLVAVRTDKAAEYVAELQSRGYTPRLQGSRLPEPRIPGGSRG
jgi:hypothetical protein